VARMASTVTGGSSSAGSAATSLVAGPGMASI
jgi:hypothetical protein